MAKTSRIQRRQNELEKTLKETGALLEKIAPKKPSQPRVPIKNPDDKRSDQEIYESLQRAGSAHLRAEQEKQAASQKETIESGFQEAQREKLEIQAQKDRAKIKTPEQRAQALVLHGSKNLHSRLYYLESFQADLLLADPSASSEPAFTDASASSEPAFTDALAAYDFTGNLNLSETERTILLRSRKKDFDFSEKSWEALKKEIIQNISKEDQAAIFRALPYETKKAMITKLPADTKNNDHIRALNFHAELLRLLMSTKGKVSGLLGGTSVDGISGRFPRHAAAMLKIIQSGKNKTPTDLIIALSPLIPKQDSTTRYFTKRDPAVTAAYASINKLMTEFTTPLASHSPATALVFSPTNPGESSKRHSNPIYTA